MKMPFAAMGAAFALGWSCVAAFALSAGDIAFVGFNADGDDNLAFVTLVPLAAGQVIYFSDNEWNGGVIGAGGSFLDNAESEIKWTAPAGGVPAGTVVLIDGIETTAPLTTSTGTVEYSSSSNVGGGPAGRRFLLTRATVLPPAIFWR